MVWDAASRGQHWFGCMRPVMQDEHLTVDQCDELAKTLREDAARLQRRDGRLVRGDTVKVANLSVPLDHMLHSEALAPKHHLRLK
jgi:hypothetical protein